VRSWTSARCTCGYLLSDVIRWFITSSLLFSNQSS